SYLPRVAPEGSNKGSYQLTPLFWKGDTQSLLQVKAGHVRCTRPCVLRQCGTTNWSLFDQLIGTNEKLQWHFKPKRFGSLKIYEQADLGGQLDREISWLRAFDDLVDIKWSPLIHREIVRAI